MASTLRTGFPLLACTALLLTGCAQSEGTDDSGDPAPATGTDKVTVTETVPGAATEPPPPPAEPSRPSCEDTAPTNPLGGGDPLPVRSADAMAHESPADVHFHYSVSDDQMDPCMPLSWVTLAGTNGTDGPGMTSGSTRETIAFFGDGQLVTDPAPILARHIDSVDRIDDSTVRVNYEFYDVNGAPAASGVFTPGSATFHWDGEQLTVTENSIPVELNEQAETLELG
ncbi:MAG: LppP/LprE family lipoprotein [Mycobacteriaceae bacterium]|uniref:LppP/LprE family lipoprotein n=1 Tax=Corynebacterium sp. TaxID=1720 RepID=UPI003F9B13C9